MKGERRRRRERSRRKGGGRERRRGGEKRGRKRGEGERGWILKPLIFGFDKNDGSEVDIGGGEWLVVELIGSTIPFSAGLCLLHLRSSTTNYSSRTMLMGSPPPSPLPVSTPLVLYCTRAARGLGTLRRVGAIFSALVTRDRCVPVLNLTSSSYSFTSS